MCATVDLIDAAPERPVPAPCRPGRRLLIVDDESHVTTAVSDYFTKLGYDVDDAASEVEALALLEKHDYAAIVTDLRLAGSLHTGGFEVVRQARRLHPAAACIVLTAFGDMEQEREARRQGADALLRKPTPLALLAVRIAGLLGRRAN